MNKDLDLLSKLDAVASETQEETPKLESKRRGVINKFTEEAVEEEPKEEKKTPGPKKVFPMKSISLNFEKSISDAIDDYCEEHLLKRSEFVRTALKGHMESLGYHFSIEDLKNGKFEK